MIVLFLHKELIVLKGIMHLMNINKIFVEVVYKNMMEEIVGFLRIY